MASVPAEVPEDQAVTFVRPLIPARAPEDRPWLVEPNWRPDTNRVLTRTVKDGRGVRALSVPELTFVDAYMEWQVPVEAARWAGYADPGAMGHVLLRRLQSVIEAERWARSKARVMGPGELLGRLSTWVRNGGEYGSATSVKSAELLGRAQGLFADKLDLRYDRNELRDAVRVALSDPKRLLEALSEDDAPVDAELVASEPQP